MLSFSGKGGGAGLMCDLESGSKGQGREVFTSCLHPSLSRA